MSDQPLRRPAECGPDRAAWLASAQQYFIQSSVELVAAFYFDRPPITANGAACDWSLTSSPDISAFQTIANDTTYFTS